MATITDLSQTLSGWLRRLRLQRALTWGLRGLVFGLALSLVLGAAGLFQAKLLREEFLALIISSAIFISLVMGVAAYLWPIQKIKAARYFDLAFRLGERVSTALELSQDGLKSSSELICRQLEDAISASRRVKPGRDLPFRLQKTEGILALALVLLIGVIWFRGETWFQAARQARVIQQAVAEETAQIEEIISQIESNPALSEEQKEMLTAPLEEALQGLEENPSLEGSVSMLSSTGEKLDALSEPQAEQVAEALKEAGNRLAEGQGNPLQSAGEKLAEGDYASAASDLANLDLSNLSAEETQKLADQLQSAADAVQSTNPQLASELNDAAEALRNGDTDAAQEALQRAADSLAKTGQQMAFSQTAKQAAGQLEEGAGQVLAAGGGQSPNSGTAGESNQGGENAGESGSGSGSEGSDESASGGDASDSPIAQNNGAGDGGEVPYEQIYAPSLLGGEGGPDVQLPTDGQDGETIGEGQTTEAQPGESLVPYNEVFSQYNEANQRAIENGSIPFQFMQIIRNYFDSLKP
ncbi:MAG: hypothetical protein HZB19_03075 [Chloroflexi bacterium]|nr:hypothetical protein [Chloroflexota bacterium]